MPGFQNNLKSFLFEDSVSCWLLTHRDPPASASQMPGFSVRTLIPGHSTRNVLKLLCFKISLTVYGYVVVLCMCLCVSVCVLCVCMLCVVFESVCAVYVVCCVCVVCIVCCVYMLCCVYMCVLCVCMLHVLCV